MRGSVGASKNGEAAKRYRARQAGFKVVSEKGKMLR